MNFFEKRRSELEKTQMEIAVALGMTPAAVSKWERGEAIPDLSLADKLSVVYGVTAEHIEREIVALHRQRRESAAVPAA